LSSLIKFRFGLTTVVAIVFAPPEINFLGSSIKRARKRAGALCDGYGTEISRGLGPWGNLFPRSFALEPFKGVLPELLDGFHHGFDDLRDLVILIDGELMDLEPFGFQL
jgi:hypothetical protein